MPLRKVVFILVSIMLAVSVSVGACAEVSGLKWGMSRADAVALLGEPNYEDSEMFQDRFVIEYVDESLLRPDAAVLVLIFKDDALVAYEYSIKDVDTEKVKFQEMVEELNARYGESTDDYGPMENLDQATNSQSMTPEEYAYFGIPFEYAVWKDADGADVVLWWCALADEAASCLVYLQPGVQ